MQRALENLSDAGLVRIRGWAHRGRRTSNHYYVPACPETFTQVPFELWDLDLTAYERAVYIVLCKFSDAHGECYPSARQIADLSGMSVRKVTYAIRGLERVGAILISSRAGRSNYYLVPSLSETTEEASTEGMHEGGRPSARPMRTLRTGDAGTISNKLKSVNYATDDPTSFPQQQVVPEEPDSSTEEKVSPVLEESATTEQTSSTLDRQTTTPDLLQEKSVSGEKMPSAKTDGGVSSLLEKSATTTTDSASKKSPVNGQTNGAARVDIREGSSVATKQPAGERVPPSAEWEDYLSQQGINVSGPFRRRWLNLLAPAERDYELLKASVVEAVRKNDWRRFPAGPMPGFVQRIYEDYEASGKRPGQDPAWTGRIDIGTDDPSLRAYRIDL